MGLYLFYFACLISRYPDVELNPGPRGGASRSCRVLYANIRGLHGNLRDLSVASSTYDVLLCAETLVSNRRHMSELQIPDFGRPVLKLRDAFPGSRGLVAYVRDGFVVSRQNRFECSCCEMLVLRVCGSTCNFYLFNLYRSPSGDDRIYDCMLNSMASIQSIDRKAAFIFVGDMNGHHRDWLGSARTDSHGTAALDFSTVSSCEQLVTGPTHQAGGTLSLVMTDVPDLVRVSVVAPLGRSDHSTLSLSVMTRQVVPESCIRQEVFLKTSVDWDGVRLAVHGLPWRDIRLCDDPGGQLEQLLGQLIRRFVPVRVIRKRSRDKPWFDDACRRAFDNKQAVYYHWASNRTAFNYDEFRRAQREANHVYALAEQQYNERSRETLSATGNVHKWWSTLKSAVFGSDPSTPPLIGDGGKLVADPVEKANLLMRHFDSKQCRDPFFLSLTCHV